MGTTAEKLTYLNETKAQLKDMLNLGGASLTTEPFRQYVDTLKNRYLYFMNNGTQQVWNNWSKVNGTGETLTLNNTEEAPMSLVYKGNTYQETTTGKNKCVFTTDSVSIPGATYNGSEIRITGTYSGNQYQGFNKIKLPAGSYTFSFEYSWEGSSTSIPYFLVNGQSTYPNKIKYFTLSGETEITMGVVVYAGTYNNAYIKAQIETGSTATAYEPYTNGASPNPDYPQDIHVVSGDNSIVVCGKNLFKPYTNTGTVSSNGVSYTMNSDYTITINGTATAYTWVEILEAFRTSIQVSTTKYINLDSSKTYSLKANIISGTYTGSANFHAQINVSGGDVYKAFNSSVSITNSDGLYRAWFMVYSGDTFNNLKIGIQLEEGEATTYEAYTGESYPISLGVENIATSYKSSGSGYFNYSYDNSKVSKNMTLSFMPNFTTTGVTIYARPKDNGTLYTLGTISTITSGVKASLPFTLTDAQITEIKANTGGFFQIYRAGVEFTESSVSDIQLSEGSTPQHISNNPIELLKIGTYQDKIDKSTGKNLFDKTTIDNGKYVKADGTIGTDNTAFMTDYIEITPNTNYYISNRTTWNSIGLYNSSKTFLERINLNYTSGVLNISNTNCKYIRINASVNDINTMMLNEGSTALEYEPYGTGWYVKKEIGKVDLSSVAYAFNYYTSTNKPVFFIMTDSLIPTYKQSPYLICYCDYYQGKGQLATFDEIYDLGNNTIAFRSTLTRLVIRDDSITSTTDLVTFLNNHKPTVYYVLATPTYTLIEDSTLIEELESMKKSYEGQTNISQVNNDMPFILDITALSKE